MADTKSQNNDIDQMLKSFSGVSKLLSSVNPELGKGFSTLTNTLKTAIDQAGKFSQMLTSTAGSAQALQKTFQAVQIPKVPGLDAMPGLGGKAPMWDDLGKSGDLMKSLAPIDKLGKSINGISKSGGKGAGMLGSALEVLGPEFAALAGPVGLAVTGAGSLVSAVANVASSLVDLAKGASAAGIAFAKIGFTGGGNGLESAKVAALGSSIGLSGEQAAGIGRNILNTITTSGVGMGFANRAGISAMPGPYGEQDASKVMLKAVNALRQIDKTSGRTEARRTAIQIGAEGLLPLLNLSDKTMGNLNKDAGVRSSIMDDKFMRNAAEFQAAMGRIGDSIENLMAAFSGKTVGTMAETMNDIADSINGFAVTIKNSSIPELLDLVVTGIVMDVKLLRDVITGHFSAIPGDMRDGMEKSYAFNKKAFGSFGGDDKTIQAIMDKMFGPSHHKDEADRNNKVVDATKDNTNALREFTTALKQGVFGGGERAQNALPKGYEGNPYMRIQAMVQGQAAMMGAFSL